MLKLNQLNYLFKGWSKFYQPRLIEETEKGFQEDRGLLIDRYNTYKDYNVVSFEADYDELIIFIKKP